MLNGASGVKRNRVKRNRVKRNRVKRNRVKRKTIEPDDNCYMLYMVPGLLML